MHRLIISVILLLVASPALAGYDECVFDNSKIVKSQLSGLRGMVVSHWRNDDDNKVAKNCRYDVRFVTDTGWVYTIEKMRPYELVWPKKETETQLPSVTSIDDPLKGLNFGNN